MYPARLAVLARRAVLTESGAGTAPGNDFREGMR
jgi:hypothetical protein